MQRITGHNAVSYDYDANGNIIRKTVNSQARTFSYNAANRLMMVDNQVLYDYNALGQRVSKQFLTPQHGKGKDKGQAERRLKHGHTRLYAYSEAGQLIGVYNHKGKPKEELIYFNGAPIASIRDGGEMYYVHTDHLGTPRIVTSETNDVVWRWDSDPFGRSQPVSEGWGDDEQFVFNLRFPGQYYDEETGLHYNYYRYYDPSTGRYMTSDPLKDLLLQFDPAVKIIPDLSKIFAKTPSFVRNNDVKKLQFLSENSYSYVKDNPVRWTDKFGLYTDCSYWGGSCTEKPDREPTYWECIAICNATLRFYCTAAAVCIGPKTFEGAKFSVQCGTVSGVYCAEQCKSLKK